MEKNQLLEYFLNVSRCTYCKGTPSVLSDSQNLPQAGFIGKQYAKSKILLIGQNPGISSNVEKFRQQNIEHSALISHLNERADVASYEALAEALKGYLREWPIKKKYFPAAMEMDNLAFINLVRCRTQNNKAPGERTVTTCIDAHLIKWIEWLKPNAIVFLGKWAFDQFQQNPSLCNIRAKYAGKLFCINRDRSLNTAKLKVQKQWLAEFIETHIERTFTNIGTGERQAGRPMLFYGSCPQCAASGVDRRVQLNTDDFWECEACRLQLSTFSPEAVILGWRGRSEFSNPSTFAATLYQQNPLLYAKADHMGKYPFLPLKKNSLFRNPEELRLYFQSVG
jgi:uracil-DNA glycosylase